jgi:hypothetical protein
MAMRRRLPAGGGAHIHAVAVAQLAADDAAENEKKEPALAALSAASSAASFAFAGVRMRAEPASAPARAAANLQSRTGDMPVRVQP